MYEYVYSPYPKLEEAIKDLRKKLDNLSFKPNLGIFFLTDKLINGYAEFSKLINCNCVCIPVEGYITPESIWARGCLALLIDTDYTLQVITGTTDEVVEKLEIANIGKTNIIAYPILYPKSRWHVIKGALKLKMLYRKYSSDPYSVLEEASKIYQDELIYPINKILRPFRDAKRDTISLNISPIEVKYGHPLIAVNGKRIGRGVVVISFNKKLSSDYTDTLPERGRTLEETKDVLRREFAIGEEVRVEKKGIAIGHIEGLKFSEFLESKKILAKKEIEKDLEKGKFFSSSPYILYFLNPKTCGGAALGLLNYPIEIYPSYFELDNFLDEAIFFAEIVRGGIKSLEKYFKGKKFDFCAVDHNFILMYERDVRILQEFLENMYGIFTSFPNYSSHSLEKKLISEIEPNIFINLTRTAVFTDWK